MVFFKQDVRIPLVGLGLILERYCYQCNIPEEANVLPHLHYILTG